MLGLGFLVCLGVLFAWRQSHGGAGAEGTGPKRVAVLPFENLGDSTAAYFADGITDEVRGKLSKLHLRGRRGALRRALRASGALTAGGSAARG